MEAEDWGRWDGKLVMEEMLETMKEVFGGQFVLLTLGSGKKDGSIALTGDVPKQDSWNEDAPTCPQPSSFQISSCSPDVCVKSSERLELLVIICSS